MTSRILPPAEWSKLHETQLPTILPHVEPDDAQIVVVEDGDRIVGSWAVLRITHLEGLWIHPEYRGRVSVARRLLISTLKVARQWAPKWVMTGSDQEPVRRMLERFGALKVPMDTYVMPVEDL